MPRRQTILIVAFCILALQSDCGSADSRLTVSTTSRDIAVDVADLQDQLEAGLQARRPQEFAFIARVVAMVAKNRLPRFLVQSTFDWARRKQPYPFPYFQRALIIRAARIGIRVA